MKKLLPLIGTVLVLSCSKKHDTPAPFLKTGLAGKNHGSYDGWIVRLNSNKDTVWTRVMGGTGARGICRRSSLQGSIVLI